MKLLIVEDDDGMAVALRAVLKPLDATIKQVQTMREAEEALNQETFQVVLLDLGLPDSSTDETLSRIKPLKAAHNVSVCVITGQPGQNEQTARIAGADSFLHKVEVMSPHRLVQIISALFSKYSGAKSGEKLDAQTGLMKQAVETVIPKMQ